MTKVINKEIHESVLPGPDYPIPGVEVVETKGVADKGSDGNIPVEVHTHDADTPTTFVGTWSANLEQSTARNGTLRVLVQTKFPVRGLYQDSVCCSGEAAPSLKAAEVTVHTVITLPKAVVDRIKAADSNIVASGASELTLAIVAHLNDLRNAVGAGLDVLNLPVEGSASIDPNSEPPVFIVKLLPVLEAEEIQNPMLADVAVTTQGCNAADNLVRFVRGSGVDNI